MSNPLLPFVDPKGNIINIKGGRTLPFIKDSPCINLFALNVGDGSFSIIQRENDCLIFDCGCQDAIGLSRQTAIVNKALNFIGDLPISAIFLTHFDSDHVRLLGILDSLCKKGQLVNTLIFVRAPRYVRFYNYGSVLVNFLNKYISNVVPVDITVIRQFNKNSSYVKLFETNFPTHKRRNRYHAVNNNSLILRLNNGFLLYGDSQYSKSKEKWSKLESLSFPNAGILMSHHGRNSATEGLKPLFTCKVGSAVASNGKRSSKYLSDQKAFYQRTKKVMNLSL